MLRDKPSRLDVVYYQVKTIPSSPDHLSVSLASDTLPPKPFSVVSPATSENDLDPWALPELQDQGEKWADLDTVGKVKRVVINILKFVGLITLLYVFICSLDFLSSAFRLLGGKAAGQVFQNSELLKNPVVGLMIGVLATVLVQSSSTSTSIVVTMVASDFLDVRTAIPIIMGANIGTSVTNTLVSFAQSGDRNEFRRAFGGATVHDMFNWLAVVVLLPIEVITGYLFHLTTAIVDSIDFNTQKGSNTEMLTVLTKPFTKLIVQLDSKVIEGIATGKEEYQSRSLLKEWCKFEVVTDYRNVTHVKNMSDTYKVIKTENVTIMESFNVTNGIEKCPFLLNHLGINDTFIGIILLVLSLFFLCSCLVLMVKILHSMLRGSIATVIRKTMNADFPGRWAYFTGYLALLVGCGMTIMVQSSSIFTSALTPLVGMGVISIERMYPLTLGSNIGTTTTGVLASLTATGSHLRSSVQIALCHLFFNVTAIVIFYPIPFMRFPIGMARCLGNTTAKYRWFSVLYLVSMFFIVPTLVFLLSLGGTIVMMSVGFPIIIVIVVVVIINLLQRKYPHRLPERLRSWGFLPEWCRSLDPLDRQVSRVQRTCGRCCACCRPKEENLASLYNTSFHSRTAILNGSILTIPSSTNLDMKAMPAKDPNGDSGIVFTSAV